MSDLLLQAFADYLAVVRRLRTDCPWDREQTHESLKFHMLEEAYEAAEAIDQHDMRSLRDELGDLLLHVSLHAIIGEESKTFTFADILAANQEKLIRRHPHVFGDAELATPHEVKQNWERSKFAEGRVSVTDGLPTALPALLRAHRLQDKVSKVGFDWKHKRDVWTKVEEEERELAEAERSGEHARIEEEFGDLLFSLVNYSRFIGVHPEEALRRSTEKFAARFRAVENDLRRRGLSPVTAGLEELDRVWNAMKDGGPGQDPA